MGVLLWCRVERCVSHVQKCAMREDVFDFKGWTSDPHLLDWAYVVFPFMVGFDLHTLC